MLTMGDFMWKINVCSLHYLFLQLFSTLKNFQNSKLEGKTSLLPQYYSPLCLLLTVPPSSSAPWLCPSNGLPHVSGSTWRSPADPGARSHLRLDVFPGTFRSASQNHSPLSKTLLSCLGSHQFPVTQPCFFLILTGHIQMELKTCLSSVHHSSPSLSPKGFFASLAPVGWAFFNVW